MKKFNNGDIIYNKIKTYPKVRFFVNSGSISYNNTDTDGNAVLFDFLRVPQQTVIEENCFILAENSDVLLAENNDALIIEGCTSTAPPP
jgi:hypothetical protein